MKKIPTKPVFVVLETRPDSDEIHSAVLAVRNSLSEANLFLDLFKRKYGGVCDYEIQESSMPMEDAS